MTRSRSRRGFTLMEVLVVLAILAALAGMVLPRILGSQKKADLNMAKTQIGLLKSSLDQYAMDVKQYPTQDQGMSALMTKPQDLDESVQWNGPYLDGEDLPKDPWGRSYEYAYPPTHGSTDRPDIWSVGPDGQEGTDDDIVSWTKTAEGGAAPATK